MGKTRKSFKPYLGSIYDGRIIAGSFYISTDIGIWIDEVFKYDVVCTQHVITYTPLTRHILRADFLMFLSLTYVVSCLLKSGLKEAKA